MNCLDVLNIVRTAGGSVSIVSGKLQVKAPAGLLSPEHKATLKQGEHLLVTLLSSDSRVSLAATPIAEADEHAVEERLAIQNEHLLEGTVEFSPPPCRPEWWSRNLTDEDNLKLDEFMGYATNPPEPHERCFKCGGRGWRWTETKSGQRASCVHCLRFVGYAKREVEQDQDQEQDLDEQLLLVPEVEP